MDAKLTLKLDKQVIEKAKDYAASKNRSLSRLIEAYLKSLLDSEKPDLEETQEISPFIRSMKTGVKLPAELEDRKEYVDYLEEKYK